MLLPVQKARSCFILLFRPAEAAPAEHTGRSRLLSSMHELHLVCVRAKARSRIRRLDLCAGCQLRSLVFC